MNMDVIFTLILLASLLLIKFVCFNRFFLCRYRAKLFEVRGKLFDLCLDEKSSLDFKTPYYLAYRRRLNAAIRLADRFSPWFLLLFLILNKLSGVNSRVLAKQEAETLKRCKEEIKDEYTRDIIEKLDKTYIDGTFSYLFWRWWILLIIPLFIAARFLINNPSTKSMSKAKILFEERKRNAIDDIEGSELLTIYA